MSLSQATISGTIKKDAEQRTTPNGAAVSSFIMDVLRYDNRAKEEKSYPVKVNMWGDAFAELVPQLKSGTRVIVTGRLQIDQFNDKNGKQVRLLTVEANRVAPLQQIASASGKSSSSAGNPYDNDEPSSFSGSESDALSEEEVPF